MTRILLSLSLLALALPCVTGCVSKSLAMLVSACTVGTECICRLPRESLIVAIPEQGFHIDDLVHQGAPREVAEMLAAGSTIEGSRWCSAENLDPWARLPRYAVECVSTSVAIRHLWVGQCSTVLVRNSGNDGEGREVVGIECRDGLGEQ